SNWRSHREPSHRPTRPGSLDRPGPQPARQPGAPPCGIEQDVREMKNRMSDPAPLFHNRGVISNSHKPAPSHDQKHLISHPAIIYFCAGMPAEPLGNQLAQFHLMLYAELPPKPSVGG